MSLRSKRTLNCTHCNGGESVPPSGCTKCGASWTHPILRGKHPTGTVHTRKGIPVLPLWIGSGDKQPSLEYLLKRRIRSFRGVGKHHSKRSYVRIWLAARFFEVGAWVLGFRVEM